MQEEPMKHSDGDKECENREDGVTCVYAENGQPLQELLMEFIRKM